MKKLRVFGHSEVTVSVVIELHDDEKLTEKEIYERASAEFGGINGYVGNGGYDKLIGVDGWDESIDADGPVEFDDFEEVG